MKDHPQLVSYVAADAIALPGEEGAAHIRDMVENYGARGIKMHGAAQGFSMSDERMWPVYGACREMGSVNHILLADVERANLAELEGNSSECERLLRQALEGFRRIHASHRVTQIEERLAR